MLLSFFGLIIGLGLLIFLTMRGINIIVAAIVCAAVVAASGGLGLEEAMSTHYMDGFTGFFKSWFLTFLLGAVFGKVMEDTQAAKAIADWVRRKLGAGRAVFAVVAACAIMTYGGVSVFIVAFSVYPIAVALFKEADLPHRFIPAALVFGSITFTMTSPGSPEIQNLIPTQFFGTTPGAGGWIGVAMALLLMVSGGLYLSRAVAKAVKSGEGFGYTYDPKAAGSANEEVAATAAEAAETKLPPILLAIAPLVLVVAALNLLSSYISTTSAVLIALLIGIFAGLVLMNKYARHYWAMFAKGTENALIATANTCAVVGFGAVAAKVPAFSAIVDTLVGLEGLEYVSLGLSVTLIAAITGSASGGLGISLPILAPIYMSQGLDPGAMHRISALASGALDSLPHNGYIVTTVRAVCHETHQRAYRPIFVLSVVIPFAVLCLAIVLYMMFT
ncbi:GntP family permease [Brevibacillus agri]|uniref:GntP family permease n=1 Tax=Brevibacillus agri TaxID=51101 RepID=UPI001C8F100A|nr:GntP family permease [Brevibacillus agri]MBY0053191.1 GntP family permease [Brevibacillus agri]